MSIKIILRKKGNYLVAVDALSIENLSKIKEGNDVVASISIPRSIQHIRLFFHILNIVYKSQPEPALFSTDEDLLDVIKIAVGHCREVKDLKGNTHFVPKSIDFSSMDQSEFSQFFDKAMDLIITQILPNCPKKTLENEVYEALRIPTYNDYMRG
jgi:hypothetical protein